MKIITITSCTKCEHFSTKPIPTPDSFERPEEWICKKKEGLIIDGYHDTFDKDPGIPKECPLEDYKK
jgi:hypothetical protein